MAIMAPTHHLYPCPYYGNNGLDVITSSVIIYKNQSILFTKHRSIVLMAQNSVTFEHNFRVPNNHLQLCSNCGVLAPFWYSQPDCLRMRLRNRHSNSFLQLCLKFIEVWYPLTQIKPVQEVISHDSVYKNVHSSSIPHDSPNKSPAFKDISSFPTS